MRHTLTSSLGQHVRINGIRQHFLHFPGDGPSLVVVPGIVSPAILWRHVGEQIAPAYNCFVLDVRGRGLSEAGAHLDYSVDACALDVIAFAAAMQLNKATVVGHSMGARIAMDAVRHAPDVFGAVVMIDPPTSGPSRREYPVPIMRTLKLLESAYRGDALQALRAGTGTPWPEPLQLLRAEWLSTCDDRAVHVAYEDFHSKDFFSDIAACAIPAVLIAAGDGGVVSDDDILEMRNLQPSLHVTRIDGVGHQMQAENFPRFKAVLLEVLGLLEQRIERSEA